MEGHRSVPWSVEDIFKSEVNNYNRSQRIAALTETEKIELIKAAIRELEAALDRLVAKIGPPMYIVEAEKLRFRYTAPDPLKLMVLKAVRVVSGLNAATVLLEAGYVVEMGVLFRTIDDYIDEIAFVSEVVENRTATTDQTRFIEAFFEDDSRTTAELLQDRPRQKRVERKKIHASQERVFGRFVPQIPGLIRRMARAIDDVYSGVVHGSQSSIMQMYEGGTECFKVRGMLDTPHIRTYRIELANYTHRALNTSSVIALFLGLTDVGDRLYEKRVAFETSEAYQD